MTFAAYADKRDLTKKIESEELSACNAVTMSALNSAILMDITHLRQLPLRLEADRQRACDKLKPLECFYFLPTLKAFA